MTQPMNPASMIAARRRVENALRHPDTRDATRVRDRLIKFHLTGDFASHLRTESVMLIRAALARSAQDLEQAAATRFSSELIEGLNLHTHPMALTLAAVLAAGGERSSAGGRFTGRSSYAMIKTDVAGFEIGIGISGHVVLMDADQYGAALAKLQG